MEAIAIAIIGVFGVVLGGIITNYFLKPKVTAETEKIASDTWEKLANKMELRVDKLELVVEKQEKKINRYGKRIIYLTNGIGILVDQIIRDGNQPCWEPNDWNPDSDQ
jgi:Na+/glutamate symporter